MGRTSRAGKGGKKRLTWTSVIKTILLFQQERNPRQFVEDWNGRIRADEIYRDQQQLPHNAEKRDTVWKCQSKILSIDELIINWKCVAALFGGQSKHRHPTEDVI